MAQLKGGWLRHGPSVYKVETERVGTKGPRAGDRFVVVVYGNQNATEADKEALAASILDHLNKPDVTS